MRKLGKGLQVFGLIVLPLATILQLANLVSLGDMLKILVAGVTGFYLGRLLEGYARPAN